MPGALAHPQLEHRNLFQTVPLDHGRQVRVFNAPFQLDGGTPASTTPPPALGAHAEEVLGELGYDAAAVAKLKQDGALG